ncbi:type II secretion system protein [Sporolactobacillus spathodeae]|uniref:Type II secretory pathway pseudopilin PulG n=1 Tax=Sporolactobacillus spathodeae TaxID=1465502 RepID=A0ABS2Q7A2_9BACL|nr:type II secretion system protein [Sporolactobacillus spathodeae]MBM7657300.1 type II secretory pathway pseudopilin PulG [Sporolactobacillus spathodeae]
MKNPPYKLRTIQSRMRKILLSIDNRRGFFLSEAVFSVAILTLMLLATVPLLFRINHQTIVFHQKVEAISLLRMQLLRWKTDDQPFPDMKVNTPFQLTWEVNDTNRAVLSINWRSFEKSYVVRSEARR